MSRHQHQQHSGRRLAEMEEEQEGDGGEYQPLPGASPHRPRRGGRGGHETVEEEEEEVENELVEAEGYQQYRQQQQREGTSPSPFYHHHHHAESVYGHGEEAYADDDDYEAGAGEVYARPGPWVDAELLPVPLPLPPPLRDVDSHGRVLGHSSSFSSAHSSSRSPPPLAAPAPHPRPAPRFVVKFPEVWESWLQTMDDTLIRWLQRPSGPLFKALSLAITACTTIELAFVVPVVLFVAGWDSLATELTYLALTTALVSQIPKRFLWRSRPYVVGRAQTRRKDKTSSFPSRAVTCAVVYTFAICFAVMERSHPHALQWWMPLLVLVAFLLASFARINLGVHYPSDCVGGLLQGALICVAGTLLWELDVVGCSSCSTDTCYSVEDNAITWHSIGRANWWVFASLFAAMAFIVGVCLAKPLDFWAKCDRVFGMLFPCVAFRVTFLCPVSLNDHASLAAPSWPPAWYSYLVGIGLAAALTVLGVANKGRYPFAAYLVFFFITFFSLSWWRLFVTSS